MATQLLTDEALARRQAALRLLDQRVDHERAMSIAYSEQEWKLDRMRELLDRLGNPQHGLPIVHVAGTKGKGSTTAMIAGVLSAAGYRTGTFTSPHLDGVEERVAVDGRCLTGEELVDLIERVRPAVEAMDRLAAGANASDRAPTYFEVTTAMALLWFALRKADAAVLEVGLGGRLDSTNVCTPRLSLITSISLDHTRQLGNTLAAIAREKAGIVKPGVAVVSGVTADEPREVIREVCRRQGAPLCELGVDFDFDYRPPRNLERAAAPGRLDFRPRKGVRTLFPERPGGCFAEKSPDPFSRLADVAVALPGRHQAANAALALAALDQLRRQGFAIDEAAVRSGLKNMALPARVEVVARRPTVVFDAAHNAASIDALVATLDESFSAARRVLVFAATREKDLRGMLARLMDRFDRVIFTRYLSNARAVPPEELESLAAELTGRRWPICADPAEAWDAVGRLAGADDLVCITGSFFIVAEMRRQLAARHRGVSDL